MLIRNLFLTSLVGIHDSHCLHVLSVLRARNYLVHFTDWAFLAEEIETEANKQLYLDLTDH